MRGDSPLRFGASGWLLIASLAVFALFLMSSTATASGGVRTPYTTLAAGETVHVAPLSVSGTPHEIAPASVTVDYTVSIRDGFQGPAPAGAPVPQPTDAPFGTEVAVTTNANAQTHPSIAGERVPRTGTYTWRARRTAVPRGRTSALRRAAPTMSSNRGSSSTELV